MKKRVKKIVIFFGIIAFIFSIIIVFFFQKFHSQFDDRKVLLELQKNNIRTQSNFIPFKNYKIHAIHIGDLKKPKILFIHGSPGVWFDFKNIFKDSLLRTKFCMISYDRPGYGLTNIPVQTSLKNQAQVAARVMDYFGASSEKFIVVGHSYGGAILEQSILDYPDKISNAIYVAPCLSPKYQKARWYNIIASGGLSKRLIPHDLSVSNMEMMALSENLEKNENRLCDINVSTFYIQGKKDVLVPYKTLYYYLQFQKNVNYRLMNDVNHFIPWSNPEIMIQAILDQKMKNESDDNLTEQNNQ
ncbi:alpha/beta fold hydrolase [Ancylomarina longa]|uniref:Alpha/beta hydrolase n=1 Tax=Ancylomarina longa TaxID=2487017 RepID=A0A434ATC1_9BACT|nr:alpha/beta hydrolase [Ancylomarina longa]RUT77657.1 alpha/beta hydrolase [Ancylomarina longa]